MLPINLARVLVRLVGRMFGCFSDLHAPPLCKLVLRWLLANLLAVVWIPVTLEGVRKGAADLFRQFHHSLGQLRWQLSLRETSMILQTTRVKLMGLNCLRSVVRFFSIRITIARRQSSGA